MYQGKCTRNFWFRLHLSLLSHCQTKYDNQNKETKHLLKLFGSDMLSRDSISASILSESWVPYYMFLDTDWCHHSTKIFSYSLLFSSCFFFSPPSFFLNEDWLFSSSQKYQQALNDCGLRYRMISLYESQKIWLSMSHLEYHTLIIRAGITFIKS